MRRTKMEMKRKIKFFLKRNPQFEFLWDGVMSPVLDSLESLKLKYSKDRHNLQELSDEVSKLKKRVGRLEQQNQRNNGKT